MGEADKASGDPRWGQENRDHKAEAILTTLRLHCRCDLTQGTWLDIGCGSGGIASTLAGQVARVVGVDPEPWNRWQEFKRRHPNIDFHVGTYAKLAELLGRDSCDVVICNQVYEHVDDPVALLGAIHTVLKPEGVCYFAGPNLLWPIEPHVFWPFVHWLPRNFAVRLMHVCRARRLAYFDANSWSYWRLTKAFRHTGFDYASAVRERIGASALRSGSIAARAVLLVPRSVYAAFTFMSPGFVFVLRKRQQSPG